MRFGTRRETAEEKARRILNEQLEANCGGGGATAARRKE
jgi:hypothetical protein